VPGTMRVYERQRTRAAVVVRWRCGKIWQQCGAVPERYAQVRQSVAVVCRHACACVTVCCMRGEELKRHMQAELHLCPGRRCVQAVRSSGACVEAVSSEVQRNVK